MICALCFILKADESYMPIVCLTSSLVQSDQLRLTLCYLFSTLHPDASGMMLVPGGAAPIH